MNVMEKRRIKNIIIISLLCGIISSVTTFLAEAFMLRIGCTANSLIVFLACFFGTLLGFAIIVCATMILDSVVWDS